MQDLTPISEKPVQQSLPSASATTIARCEPATVKQGKMELGACLTLVSPASMTAQDRAEWLAVAMHTLSGIPADLLKEGCAAARKRCRFPSEIVPTIYETVEQRWRWRMEAERRAAAPPLPPQTTIAEPLARAADFRGLLKKLESKSASAIGGLAQVD